MSPPVQTLQVEEPFLFGTYCRAASLGRLPWPSIVSPFFLFEPLYLPVACGAVPAVVGALWLARFLLSRSPRIVGAGVLGSCLARTGRPNKVSVVVSAVWDDLVAMFLAPKHPGSRQKVSSETVKQ